MNIKICLISLLLILGNSPMAGNAAGYVPAKNGAEMRFKIKGGKYHVKVRQMPLARALKTIGRKTGVPLHESLLPEDLINATCVGRSLKPVLECLINKKADIVVRYARGKNRGNHALQLAEAWIIGANTKSPVISSAPETRIYAVPSELKPSDEVSKAEISYSDQLINTARTGNPQQRSEAIINLLSVGPQNDPKVKALLEEAVHDKNATVRAQAVSTLTHRSDYAENATAIIQEALHDSSVDVRMMAVDGIIDDESLLRQALNDEDETVRTLATMKLDELLQKKNLDTQ